MRSIMVVVSVRVVVEHRVATATSASTALFISTTTPAATAVYIPFGIGISIGQLPGGSLEPRQKYGAVGC